MVTPLYLSEKKQVKKKWVPIKLDRNLFMDNNSKLFLQVYLPNDQHEELYDRLKIVEIEYDPKSNQ